MIGPTVRYPAGPITPAGAYHILHDRIPQVALQSYDDTVVFNMMGGLSLYDPTKPERVNITGINGLIPPWQTIDQKGATQDGISFVDAIYDPIEVELTVKAKGRNPAYTRKVVNHLIASIDAKQQSELSWTTQALGHWWAPIRWFKTPANPMAGIATSAQELQLRLRADDGFWRSYDNSSDFAFIYEDFTDTFNYVTPSDLGSGWTIAYSGAGGGNLSANGDQALWHEVGTAGRKAVARRNGFTTATNDQVVSMVLGSFAEWHLVSTAYNDLWARMNNTGTPGTSGIRLRIGFSHIILSYFIGGVETVMRQYGFFNPLTWIPPYPGEKFQLVAGYEENTRLFKVLRNGSVIMSVPEPTPISLLGASNRSVGFGMEAGSDVFDQASPANIRKIAAGDNNTVTQSGFLERINAGDQPGWDRFTCFGPGIFRIGNGPGSDDLVEFGKLLPNQIMYLRTDPRKRGVTDLTQIPPTPQELDYFQKALLDYYNFASGNNITPLQQASLSQFGINPPQGNPYSLLKGRWSNPIPAKSPGKPAEKYHVKVQIDEGNADSRIIAALTPLRRNPY